MRDAAQFFKVLADEVRLKILWLLFHHKELCVCDIMSVLEITQSKASRHLATLKHAGLVSDRKEGLWSHYALRPARDELAKTHLALLRRSLASRPDADSLLKTLQGSVDGKKQVLACSKAAVCATKTTRLTTKRTAGSAP